MSASPPVTPARHRRRRKIIISMVAVLLVLGIVGGAIAYRMVNAIVDAEQAAVVPLPTRSTNFGAYSVPTPTPQPVATGVVETADPPGPGVSATIASVSAPTATAAVLAPTVTSPAQSGPAPTATLDPYRPLPTGDDPSHFDVLTGLWGAVENNDPGTSDVWGGKTDIYLMLLGVDRRADGGDQNADVILVVHVDLINERVSAISVPRDLLVDIPGVGQDKINSAYNYGYKGDPTNKASGVAKMRDTIESVLQVPIDGYILVDFNGFTDVVDEMGGVDINVPGLLIDDDYPTADYGTETVTFLPGEQHMDGERALKYVRTRHQDSDDGRRERQIQVLRALFLRAKTFGSITNGFKIVSTLGGAVQTNFSLEQQLTLAKLGYDMQDADIYTASLTPPLINGQFLDNGAWVYMGDAAQIRAWAQGNLATDPQPVQQATPGAATSTEFTGTGTWSPYPATPTAADTP